MSFQVALVHLNNVKELLLKRIIFQNEKALNLAIY